MTPVQPRMQVIDDTGETCIGTVIWRTRRLKQAKEPWYSHDFAILPRVVYLSSYSTCRPEALLIIVLLLQTHYTPKDVQTGSFSITEKSLPMCLERRSSDVPSLQSMLRQNMAPFLYVIPRITSTGFSSLEEVVVEEAS